MESWFFGTNRVCECHVQNLNVFIFATQVATDSVLMLGSAGGPVGDIHIIYKEKCFRIIIIKHITIIRYC